LDGATNLKQKSLFSMRGISLMKYLVGALTAIFVVALILLSSQMGSRPPLPQQQLFANGQIITMDSNTPFAEAMVLERQRIVWLGSTEEAAQRYPSLPAKDLAGKTVIPGFIDAHGHFPGSGLSAFTLDMNSPPTGTVDNIADIQSTLRTAAKHKQGWLVGMGYDDSLLAEARHPNRSDLDAVTGDRPAFLLHVSGHMGVANSAALALVGIDRHSIDPEGGRIVRDKQGEPTGLLLETAAAPVQLLAMDFSAGDFFRMIDVASADYLRLGVTTAQSGGVDAKMLQGLWLASMLHRVPQRLEVWPLWKELGEQLVSGSFDAGRFQSESFHIGAIKIIADGSIQGYTGFLGRPYHQAYEGDETYRGFPLMSADELKVQVASAQAAGYQLAIHGNGDAAIDMVLDAIEAAQASSPTEDIRHIIIHAQMARDDQLKRMQQLGASPSFFSAHTYYWGDRHRDIFMGPQRAARMSPARSAEQIGLRYSVHLDTPVVPMDPLLLLWSTVNRVSASGAVIGADQRVTVENALRAMTIDAAWQIHREQELGSLAPGKLADFIVLDKNPLSIKPDNLRDLRVEATYIGGRRYYQRLAN
ncbi:MAG: putative amidohydrolase YtcJ, partial [Bacteroidia bacterium]